MFDKKFHLHETKENRKINLLFMLRREPVERREFLSLGGEIEIQLKQGIERHALKFSD